MTEDEFVVWCREHDDILAEWADGEIIIMSPASREHNNLNGWILSALRVFVEHHGLGEVFGPEYQVRLAGQKRRRVPDVFFLSTARLGLAEANHLDEVRLIWSSKSSRQTARHAIGAKSIWNIRPPGLANTG